MAGRAFRVKVQLEVHAVTCPGVWLCPNGKVALRINTLDSCAESRGISPIFPLLFHDRFTFGKVFARTTTLAELQRALEREFLHADLIQWATPISRGITLATFETSLADLLYPAPCYKGLLAGVDVDLLMEPTKHFPGIIAPKIEVSTRTIVEEVLGGAYDTSMSKCHVVNPKMINSKQASTCGPRKRPTEGIIRQRRVCHTKPRSRSCRPCRQRSSSVGDTQRCPSCSASREAEPRADRCYHSTRKDLACASRSCLRKPAVRDDAHVTDDCPVCSKYNCYFSKCYDDSDAWIGRRVDFMRGRPDDAAHYREESPDDDEEYYCVCASDSASDAREEEPAMSLLRSKGRSLRRTREQSWPAADQVAESYNPSREFARDHSSQGFYKNLEKFYRRMYKQAKMRAQEAED